MGKINDGFKSVQVSSHDRQILEYFYGCFDRPAFQVNFLHESDLDDLSKALKDTIAALSTGIKKFNEDVIGAPTEPKAYFENREIRTAFDKIVSYLNEARFIYIRSKESGYFLPCSSGQAFHRDHQKEAVRVAVMVDELRNKALEEANIIYSKIGMVPFPYIKTSDSYRSASGLPPLNEVNPGTKSKYWTLFDIFEWKPSFFGFSIDLKKAIKFALGKDQ